MQTLFSIPIDCQCMSFNMETCSTTLRNEGNSFYNQATQKGLRPWTVQDLLQKGIRLYQEALKAAKGDDETASACKNIAQSYRIMATTFDYESKSEVERWLFFLVEALEKFKVALQCGASCKSQLWLDSAEEGMNLCFESVIEVLGDKEASDKKIDMLRKLYEAAPTSILKGRCILERAVSTFKLGVKAYELEDFTKCLQYMSDCRAPLAEATKHDPLLSERVGDYQQRVFMHICICESVQKRKVADSLFRAHIFGEEVVNFDFVWDVIDMFKHAVILTREKDAEQEAISLSRMGKMFESVVKLPDKAKEYYKRSFQLALSLHPRTFNIKGWYQDCSSAVERYQQETYRREAEEAYKDKEKYLKELKPELDSLKEAFQNGGAALVRYLYKKYPPSNPSHTMVEPDGNLKKSLMVALKHYHPDKQTKDSDEKRFVLYEEITKLLLEKYEIMK